MIVSLPSPRLQLRVKDHFNQWRNTRAPTIQREERVLVYREQDHYQVFSTGLILISFPRHFFNCSLWIYRKSDCFIINKPTVFVITDKREKNRKNVRCKNHGILEKPLIANIVQIIKFHISIVFVTVICHKVLTIQNLFTAFYCRLLLKTKGYDHKLITLESKHPSFLVQGFGNYSSLLAINLSFLIFVISWSIFYWYIASIKLVTSFSE